MHPLFLILISVFSFHNFNSYPIQRQGIKPAPTEDRVIIQRRRVVLVRSGELAKQFPERKTAIVYYPVISGLSDLRVLRRVRSLLEFKNIFGSSLQEYRESAWLSEFTYVINYNSNYLLDITFTQTGTGAYPDEQSKHFLINLRDGSLVKPSDVFQSDKLGQIIALINRELHREIKVIESKNEDLNNRDDLRERYDQLKFKQEDLEDFSVGPKGITFRYDAGFPHAIKALQPRGRYLVHYGSLRRVIKRDGLLGQFAE